MRIKNLLILAILLIPGLFISCDEDDDLKVENSSTHPVSGDWTVTYKVETSPNVFEDIYGVGETHLLVYNTAADNGQEIWVDDHGNFWAYKVKANVNMSNLTFSGSELGNQSELDDPTNENQVTITDGKVIKDGTMVTGARTDSIYFRVSFSDDEAPYGTIYHVSGHRSTGF
ncbi:lipid-binding protein [Pontibacter beigongshangensis]|uniref:lipid-binding protein n=1 Tax=Pontibacter beigongshangensis TaxID=2574733 RepID=UPI00164F5D76|nr:lipid-binding protein [Pontibacter beigongshangensis]